MTETTVEIDNQVEISYPQPSQVAVTDVQKMLTAAKAFRITTPESAVEMQETRRRINARIKTLTEERLGITRQQVINLRKAARLRLGRRMRRFGVGA